MDDDTRSPFKKRYEYKEHGSYHSFQLHWVWDDVLIIQNIFAFVCRSRQTTAELIEMWVRVKIWVCYALNFRRLTTVFLALGWIFSNQYLAWKTCFDFHHTRPPFQSMIKFYVLVGFQATAVTIATVTQSTSFWITSIISKSSQTLGNETCRWALRWLRCKVFYVLKRAKISPKAYNLHKSKYFKNGVTDFIFQLWDVRTIIPLHRSHLRAHSTLRMLCCDKTLLDSNGKLKVLFFFAILNTKCSNE